MIGAAIAAAGSLANAGMGIYDRIKSAKEYKKAQSFFERNKYEIPASAQASLGIAQRNASSLRAPGQSLAEARLGQNTASGVEQARRVGSNPSDVLAMLSNLYGSQNQAEQNLAMQSANQYTSNQRNFQNALGQYANLEDKKWQYNVLYPYQQMLGRAAAFGDRGTQELNSGIGGLAQTGAMAMQNAAMERQYQMWGERRGFGQPGGSTAGLAGFMANRGGNPLRGYGGASLDPSLSGRSQMNPSTDWSNRGEYPG